MPQTTTKPWQRQRDNVNRNDRHEPHWPIATPSYHLGGIPARTKTHNILIGVLEWMMGVEPTYPAWKAGILADVLHPHNLDRILFQNPFLNICK